MHTAFFGSQGDGVSSQQGEPKLPATERQASTNSFGMPHNQPGQQQPINEGASQYGQFNQFQRQHAMAAAQYS